jgi:hypothetical protein
VPIELSSVQSAVYDDTSVNRVWIAGRQSGKSFEAVLECVRAASRPGAKVWYLGPTREHVRDLAWGKLKEIIPKDWITSANETRMSVMLSNGSEIRLQSAEEPARLRGPSLDFAVLDEFAFMDSSVWDALEPALAYRQGRALFISTPRGFNWAYDFYVRGIEKRQGWKSWQTTTAQSGQISPERLAQAQMDHSPAHYRQEYEASFEAMSGRVYSNFSRKPVKDGNIDSTLVMKDGPLLIGMDFNVNPMTYVVAQQVGDECHVFASVEVASSNTEEVAEHIRQVYGQRAITICPDPSAGGRKTSAPVGMTDITILQRHGFIIDKPKGPIPLVDNINNVQTNLLAANGRRRLIISPEAKLLIKGLDGLTYKEGTNMPDKNVGLDHVTDALSYLLWQRFNRLQQHSTSVSTVRI